ncbi:hypothetical protein OROMI_021000 [Orobanche minor]
MISSRAILHTRYIFQQIFIFMWCFCTAAIIIDSHAPRTVTAKGKENTLREYAAVDELISLSSTFAYVILINSNIERVQALQKWYFIYKERIDVLQQQSDVFQKAQTNFSSDPKTFTPIQTLLTIEHVPAPKF